MSNCSIAGVQDTRAGCITASRHSIVYLANPVHLHSRLLAPDAQKRCKDPKPLQHACCCSDRASGSGPPPATSSDLAVRSASSRAPSHQPSMPQHAATHSRMGSRLLSSPSSATPTVASPPRRRRILTPQWMTIIIVVQSKRLTAACRQAAALQAVCRRQHPQPAHQLQTGAAVAALS